MKTIWKFPIPVVNPAMVRMPKGAEILTVQCQGDQACLWAIVEPEKRGPCGSLLDTIDAALAAAGREEER